MLRPPDRAWIISIACAVILVGGVAAAVTHDSGHAALSTSAATSSTAAPVTADSTTTPAAAPTGPATTAPPSGTTATPPASVKFAGCGGVFQCAKVTVPLDYAKPEGKTIDIAVVRRPANDPSHRVGVLLTNPGGPGASGVGLVKASSGLFGTLRDRFDLVGFDPRGVGESAPVRCLEGPALDRYIALDPDPDTAAEKQALIDGAKEYDAACQARSGALLPFVGTPNAARDMDRIRIALGEAQISYLGFSYGTLLGATYATLFPDRVRAFVLDGAVDPTLGPLDTAGAQAIGFEEDLAHFLDDCKARTACPFRNGGDPAGALDRFLAQADATPIPVGTRSLGPSEAFLGVLAGLYQKSSWPALASALAAAQSGNAGALLRLADSYADRRSDGTYSNQIDANNAVNCVDAEYPKDPSAYDAFAAQLKVKAPHFGGPVAYAYSCAFWPAAGGRERLTIDAKGSAPILVVGATADPATPYVWSQALTNQLEHARLLTRNGDGHTSYIASSCIQAKVDAYLVDGTLPAVGTTCV